VLAPPSMDALHELMASADSGIRLAVVSKLLSASSRLARYASLKPIVLLGVKDAEPRVRGIAARVAQRLKIDDPAATEELNLGRLSGWFRAYSSSQASYFGRHREFAARPSDLRRWRPVLQENEDGTITYLGYRIRLLTGQAKSAPGGKIEYMENGKLVYGWALVVYPENYGEKARRTYLFHYSGTLHAKDLGKDTGKEVSRIKRYALDPTWKNTGIGFLRSRTKRPHSRPEPVAPKDDLDEDVF
jgi:hypothetical protein